MGVSRRNFLWVGLGLFAAGCAQHQQVMTQRPGPEWPESAGTPNPWPGRGYPVAPQSPGGPGRQVVPPSTPPRVTGPSVATAGPLQAIPRSQWARAAPVMTNINPMGGVDRITVHHEGWKEVYFTDINSTAAQIEKDRRGHVDDRHWGDIGYHYIVDRAGRLWQGRDVRYQGAHVESNNEHNIGVMCLGNFDLQSPSPAQMATLQDTLIKLMRHYRLRRDQVFTHKELRPTACPGRALQPQMVWMRGKQGPLATA